MILIWVILHIPLACQWEPSTDVTITVVILVLMHTFAYGLCGMDDIIGGSLFLTSLNTGKQPNIQTTVLVSSKRFYERNVCFPQVQSPPWTKPKSRYSNIRENREGEREWNADIRLFFPPTDLDLYYHVWWQRDSNTTPSVVPRQTEDVQGCENRSLWENSDDNTRYVKSWPKLYIFRSGLSRRNF